MYTQNSKLRENTLWMDAYACTEHVYKQLDLLAENHPKEKWATASKLRTAAADGMFFISKAIAGMTPESNLHDWDQARRHYFAMQSIYLLAGKQKFIELDPEIVVKLDNLLEIITKKIVETRSYIELEQGKELEPWIKKYELWQKIQK